MALSVKSELVGDSEGYRQYAVLVQDRKKKEDNPKIFDGQYYHVIFDNNNKGKQWVWDVFDGMSGQGVSEYPDEVSQWADGVCRSLNSHTKPE